MRWSSAGVSVGRPFDARARIGCWELASASLAFRLRPRLRASLESIAQARGREDIAFAAFLPALTSAYSVGGFDMNLGGAGIPLPNSPPFNFIPFTRAVPVGLDIRTICEFEEPKLQWLVCDFGRRMGRYNQAQVEIARRGLATAQADQAKA